MGALVAQGARLSGSPWPVATAKDRGIPEREIVVDVISRLREQCSPLGETGCANARPSTSRPSSRNRALLLGACIEQGDTECALFFGKISGLPTGLDRKSVV